LAEDQDAETVVVRLVDQLVFLTGHGVHLPGRGADLHADLRPGHLPRVPVRGGERQARGVPGRRGRHERHRQRGGGILPRRIRREISWSHLISAGHTSRLQIRFSCAPRKLKFFVGPMNLVDLFAILPFLLDIIIGGLQVSEKTFQRFVQKKHTLFSSTYTQYTYTTMLSIF